ncbi:MAG: hypothetical protein ACLS6G_08315 [Christensenellales bacterium]
MGEIIRMKTAQKAALEGKSVNQMGWIAEDYGISLSMKRSTVLKRHDQYCGRRTGFSERVDCPSVKALLDTFHMNIEEDD